MVHYIYNILDIHFPMDTDALGKYSPMKNSSDYDQEIPQSQTADNPVAPRT